MKMKTIILVLVWGAISAGAETLELNGIVISFPGGARVVLSLDGDIQSIIMPAGEIKKDESGQIEDVGGAKLKRDESGQIDSMDGEKIRRDDAGNITSIGGAKIKRDDAGKIDSVDGAKIRRDDSGIITGVDENNADTVQPLFKVVAD